MTTIAINGACGRMGLTVGRLAKDLNGFEVALALEGEGHKWIGQMYPPAPKTAVGAEFKDKVDALIDFSTPEGTLKRLAECVEKGVPSVICTTGFTDEQRKEIEAAAEKIPVVFASNMSVGVNALFKLVPEFEKALGAGYDSAIVETHHIHKKDAPSGTAKTLQERMSGDPDMHSLRLGDEVGEHRVIFQGHGERIEIVHKAMSRDVFARGALRAAEWAAKAEPGLYTMLDVIGKA